MAWVFNPFTGKLDWTATGGASLTVEEQDTDPSVSSVSTMKFPNSSITDDGSGTVSVNIPTFLDEGSFLDGQASASTGVDEGTF